MRYHNHQTLFQCYIYWNYGFSAWLYQEAAEDSYSPQSLNSLVRPRLRKVCEKELCQTLFVILQKQSLPLELSNKIGTLIA